MVRALALAAALASSGCALIDGLQGREESSCIPDGPCFGKRSPQGTGFGLPDLIAIANLNGDALPDLVVSGQGGISLIYNRGDQTFEDQNLERDNVIDFAVGRFDGDALDDLAVLIGETSPDEVLIYLGADNVTDVAASKHSIPMSTVYEVVAIDVDGVNGDDLVLSSTAADDTPLLLGDGNGGFTAGTALDTVARTPRELTAGDYDGDGALDLAYLGQSELALLTGDGAGGFSEEILHQQAQIGGVLEPLRDQTSGADLLVHAEAAAVLAKVYGTDGEVAGTIEISWAIGGVYDTGSGDLDGDGQDDLAVVASQTATTTIVVGTGWNGSGFADELELDEDTIGDVEIADFDGNGLGDLVFVDYNHSVLVFRFAEPPEDQ